jgi:hypothetical protein
MFSLDNLRNSLPVSVIAVAITISGGWIKDRVLMETRDSAMAVQVQELRRSIDELRADMREIRTAIEKR